MSLSFVMIFIIKVMDMYQMKSLIVKLEFNTKLINTDAVIMES